MKVVKFLQYGVLCFAAALSFSACSEKEEGETKSSAVVSISASSNTFTNNAAVITLSLTEEAGKDVSVILDATGTLASNISFEKSQTIKAGAKQVKIPVSLNPEGLAEGDLTATISIASATVDVDPSANSVVLSMNVLYPVITLAAPEALEEGNTSAIFTLNADIKSMTDVTVTLALAAASGDATALTAKEVTIPQTVTIEAGVTTVTFTAEVGYDALAPINYDLGVAISAVSDNAKIGEAKEGHLLFKGPLKANQRTDWSVAYKEVNADGNDTFTVTGTGDGNYYIFSYEEGDIAESFDAVVDYIHYMNDNQIEKYLDEYVEMIQSGETADLGERLPVGDYEVWILGCDADGHLTGDYTTATFKLEPTDLMKAYYPYWLGEWEVDHKVWTIEQDVENVSFIIKGVDGQSWDLNAKLNWDGGLDLYNQEAIEVDEAGNEYGFFGLSGSSLWFGSFVIATGTLTSADAATLAPATAPNGATFSSMAFLQVGASSIYLAGSQIALPIEMARPSDIIIDDSAVVAASYADFIGTWDYSGYDLTIAQLEDGVSYTIAGFPGSGYDPVVANFAEGALTIAEQDLGEWNHSTYGACKDVFGGVFSYNGTEYGYYPFNADAPGTIICTFQMHESGNFTILPGECAYGTFVAANYGWVITNTESEYVGRGNKESAFYFNEGAGVPAEAAGVAPKKAVRAARELQPKFHAMNAR